MKKRSVLVGLLVLCMLILGGCGEKEKFDKAHAEVMQLMKQAVAVKAETLKLGQTKTLHTMQKTCRNRMRLLQRQSRRTRKLWIRSTPS